MKHKGLWIASTVALITGLPTAIAYAYFKMGFDRYNKAFAGKEDPTNPERLAKQMLPFRENYEHGRDWINKQLDEKIAKRVRINTVDGLRLSGVYIPCESAKRTVICVHGYRGAGVKDFACIAEFYNQHQCNLLIVDLRAHGESQGRYIDFGVESRFDVVSWSEYINEISPQLPIYLDGVSMGASTVLMASELQLPDNVCGIISDCGFSSPWKMVKLFATKAIHIPPHPLVDILYLFCKRIAGIDLKEASPLEAVANTDIPILFVHGNEDTFVPSSMAHELFAACKSPKKLRIVDKAPHAVSYLIDKKNCEKEILEFFKVIEAKVNNI